jgi:hypothetical protein
MNTRHVTWLTLLALAACDTGGGGDGASAEDAGGADAGEVDARVSLECIDEDYPGEDWLAEPPVPIVSAEWTDRRTLVVTISKYAELGPYWFGLAETGSPGGDGWQGENCFDDTVDDYDLCHPVPPDGVLTLTSVNPDEGGSIDQLEEGVTTLMNAARAPGLTYLLVRTPDLDSCWTWGHDPQFYIDAAGCELLE